MYKVNELFNDGRAHTHCVTKNGKVITNAAMHVEDAKMLASAMNVLPDSLTESDAMNAAAVKGRLKS